MSGRRLESDLPEQLPAFRHVSEAVIQLKFASLTIRPGFLGQRYPPLFFLVPRSPQLSL
jgi:hypothetical protein